MIPDLSHILVSFGQLTPAILLILRGIAGTAGLVFGIHALLTIYRISMNENTGPQNRSMIGPISELVIAGVLWTLAADNLVVQNIFASITTQQQFQMPQQLALMPAAQDLAGLRIALGLAIENIMFLVGTFAIMRGLIILKRTSYGEQNYKLSSVLSYMISGSLALNINKIVKMFDNTIGTKFGEILFGQ